MNILEMNTTPNEDDQWPLHRNLTFFLAKSTRSEGTHCFDR